ncbi:hypothetical protein K220099C10_19480 [Bacteroides thetaiotaomicron]|jgi:hypothetical protein
MDMKRLILPILFLFVCSCLSYAQKGSNQFGLSAGYEHFPELHEGKGYNIGIEFKQYIHNRFFVVANFHTGINDGSKHVNYTTQNTPYNFDLNNSVRDYMIGFGLGADLLQKGRHNIYIQGTAGLGSSERTKDGIVTSPGGNYDMVKTFEEKSIRFAISATAGYDYRVNNWLKIGINYTGYQIGYEYNNSFNAKLSFIFR